LTPEASNNNLLDEIEDKSKQVVLELRKLWIE
jgi:hypothetical protein